MNPTEITPPTEDATMQPPSSTEHPPSSIQNPACQENSTEGSSLPAPRSQHAAPAAKLAEREAADLGPAFRHSLTRDSSMEVALVPKQDHCLALNSQQSTINLPAANSPRKIRRNGRVASLPRIQRDMVNRMLWNSVPYKNIVAALDDAGYTVTERNISNWATGGYLEWSMAQEHVLQNRLDQDHLIDFLRRDDASELPEVGLQAAATRLSQVLLKKLAHAEDPEAHLENYTKLIDLLMRLNREITTTQKNRDASRRTLGPEHDPVLVKDTEEFNALEMERYYSNPPSEANLPKPPARPAVPPVPTATLMAQHAEEERRDAELRRAKRTAEMLKQFTGHATLAGSGGVSPASVDPTPTNAKPASDQPPGSTGLSPAATSPDSVTSN